MVILQRTATCKLPISFLSSFSSLATLGLLLLTRWVDHRFGKDTNYLEAAKPEPRGAVDGLWFTRGVEFLQYAEDLENVPVSGSWPMQTTKVRQNSVPAVHVSLQ